jgi:hypothetical protein
VPGRAKIESDASTASVGASNIAVEALNKNEHGILKR